MKLLHGYPRPDNDSIKWFAALLAHSDDEQQSLFFNTFIKDLSMLCGNHSQTEMQLCYVNKKLTKEAVEHFGMLAYREKEIDALKGDD